MEVSPTPPPRLSYPTKSQTWGIVGIFIGSSLLAALVVVPMQSLLEATTLSKPIQGSITDLIGYCLPMLFTIWYGRREHRMRQTDWDFSWKAVSPWLLLLLVPMTLSVGIVLEPAVEAIPMPDFVKKLFDQFFKNTWISFLLIGVFGPILEELLLRGVVLDGLLKNYSPRFSIIFSAFIFGLIHLNPWQFIPAFVIGLLMGWLYWKTNSLWPCILMHIFNNSLSASVVMLLDDPWASTKAIVGDQIYWGIYAVAVIVLGGGIWLLYQHFEKNSTTQDTLLGR